MSANISCRITTSPGVTARLSPTLKEWKSTCDGTGRPATASQEVLIAVEKGLASAIDGRFDCRRVAEKKIGGRKCLADLRKQEFRATRLLRFKASLLRKILKRL